MGRGDWVVGFAILGILVLLFIHTLTADHPPALPVLAGSVVLLQVVSMVREFAERSIREDPRRDSGP